jgi:2,3-bisphosphoglycerate-independent phosphoglycerate mutase
LIEFPYLDEICVKNDQKIVMLVVDGLGGLPDPDTGKSELETASIPNLDALARVSEAGVTTPVMPGITPGSGPGHMALFGYDPVKYLVGRGACEALGVDIDLGPNAVAARGNFCTLDEDGNIVDRRAGRMKADASLPLVEMLNEIEVSPDVTVGVYPVESYRFVLVLKGEGLGYRIADTDPQKEGVAPKQAVAKKTEDTRANWTAELVNSFVKQANAKLKGQEKANSLLLRGFSREPVGWPNFGSRYKLNPGAIAAYPMYRGLAKITGMANLTAGDTFDTELEALERNFANHDYFFLHYKPADGAGEDGEFDLKVKRLEELDTHIPKILALNPDVLIVAGDHSTPSIMGAHSWHPVPLLIKSKRTKHLGVNRFTEKACSLGSLGHLSATNIMILALAHAGKLNKFGA